MTNMSVLACYGRRIVDIAWNDTHECANVLCTDNCSYCVNWETRPWITHMSVLLRCALRIVAIAWIDTHECATVLNCTYCINWNTPVNYTHECAHVLCTENCRYCLNWHTRPWITLMSVLLCCALRIVDITGIDTHTRELHTWVCYCAVHW